MKQVRVAPYLLMVLALAVPTAALAGPQHAAAARAQAARLQMQKAKAEAPGAVADTDPPLCPTQGSPDPLEKPLGALSSRAKYEFASQPNIQNLYARLRIFTQVCTDSTLSSQDRGRLWAVLNSLQVKKAQSFAATLSLTGDGLGGIKYPQISPFSYSYDQSSSTYSVQTISDAALPWQVTDSFGVQYSYSASQNLSINTEQLFGSIVTDVSGAGGTTALLSPAANAYLSAAQTVLQDVAQSVFRQVNTGSDSSQIQILQGPDRSITYRFRDLKNNPLAAVRIVVAFTNSIANPIPVDPTTPDSTHVPHFDQLPDILDVTVGGPPSGPQTLLQEISKEPSYQALLKSTTDTDAASFKGYCDQLESALQTTYGLNIYDTALAMGQILKQENTLYLNSKKFYSSGCFQSRGVLKTMGIMDFETAPTS